MVIEKLCQCDSNGEIASVGVTCENRPAALFGQTGRCGGLCRVGPLRHPAGSREGRCEWVHRGLLALPRATRRRIQRTLGVTLAGAASLLVLGAVPQALAAEIQVTTLMPEVDAMDGACSIIEAMVNAEDDRATHPDCAPGDGADTVSLPAGSITLTRPHVTRPLYGEAGLPLVTGVLTLAGNPTEIRHDPDSAPFRILEVTGDLTLRETTVSGNIDQYIYGRGTPEWPCRLTVENSLLTWAPYSRSADYGIQARYCTTTIRGSTVVGQDTGLEVLGGDVSVLNSTFVDNGAGIRATYGADVTINHTTLSDHGTGVEVDSGSFLQIGNSIVIDESASSDAIRVQDRADLGATAESIGGNLIVPAVDAGNLVLHETDFTGRLSADTVFAGLTQDHGGPTPTRALHPLSAARNRVPDCGTVDVDQRGMVRPAEGPCDSGAYETDPEVRLLVTTVDPGVNDGDGECSLVEALENTQTSVPPHADCSRDPGEPMVVLPPDTTIALDSAHEIDPVLGASGLPVIRRMVTIDGNGSTITRVEDDGVPEFRLLTVDGSGTLIVRNTVLTGGAALASVGEDDALTGFGGGILNHGGVLLMDQSSVNGNRADYGGGVAIRDPWPLPSEIRSSSISGNTAERSGGGVHVSSGPLLYENGFMPDPLNPHRWLSGEFRPVRITTSAVRANSAVSGGGIGVADPQDSMNPVFVLQSVVTGNTATAHGGGVYSGSADVTLGETTVSRNTARFGGGVGSVAGEGLGCCSRPSINVDRSTLSDNRATALGGGAYSAFDLRVNLSTVSNNSARDGAGFFQSADQLTLDDLTLFGNEASRRGGGVFAAAESGLFMDRVISAGNAAPLGGSEVHLGQAADAWVRRSVLGDAAVDADQAFFMLQERADIADTIVATRDSNGPYAVPEILDPRLARNGGFTRTHVLVAGSPASEIEERFSSICNDQDYGDQRQNPDPGEDPRFQLIRDGCDAGAVELDGVANLNEMVSRSVESSTYSVSVASAQCGDRYSTGISYTLELRNDGLVPVEDLRVFTQPINDRATLVTSAPNGALGEPLVLAKEGAYADGFLEPAESVTLRMTHCAMTQPGLDVAEEFRPEEFIKRLNVLGRRFDGT